MASDLPRSTHISPLRLHLENRPVIYESSPDFELCVYGLLHNPDDLTGVDWSSIERPALARLVRGLGGYFCLHLVQSRPGREYVANDIFGNYRLYRVKNPDGITFFDSWPAAQQQLNGDVRRSHFEYEYFLRHNYTSGGRTMVHEVDKLRPGQLVCVNDGQVSDCCYLEPAVSRRDDDHQYRNQTLSTIRATLGATCNPDRPTFLMFTGGIDSTYLACALRESGTPFTPLFVQFNPSDRDNRFDCSKAEEVATRLGLKLKTIETDAGDQLQRIPDIARRQPFDRSYAIPFEHAFETLRREFGPCQIVNGQSSDSIYCWGSSGRTVGAWLQRLLVSEVFYRRSRPVRWMVSGLIGAIYRRRWSLSEPFRVPYEGEDYWLGLLDPQGYVPVVLNGPDRSEYRSYLRQIVREIAHQVGDGFDARRTYMKLMYLQGPTNLGLIELARAHRHKLVLPFVDARLVRLRRKFQSDFRNLWRPRYVLTDTLRQQFGFDPAACCRISKGNMKDSEDLEFEKLLEQVFDVWKQVQDEIF